ncbi:putative ribosomal protein L30, partial [Hamiltosporidium magnivora]
RGTRQTIKKILRKEALVVFLTEDSNKNVGELIKALTTKYDIPLLPLEDSTELGKIVGFEKVKLGGETRVAKCSVACVVDYVRNSEGKVFLENTLRDMQAKN